MWRRKVVGVNWGKGRSSDEAENRKNRGLRCYKEGKEGERKVRFSAFDGISKRRYA